MPRLDMVAVDIESSLMHVAQQMVDGGHSRLPVFEESIDHIYESRWRLVGTQEGEGFGHRQRTISINPRRIPSAILLLQPGSALR